MNEEVLVNSDTIDEKQKDFFSKVSTIWWDLGDEMNVLHYAGAVTLKYIRDTLASNNIKQNSGVSIVDVGCGGGILSEVMAKQGYTVVGIDVNENVIQVAKEHAALDKTLTNLTYHLISVEEYASQNPEKYDVVILSYVLQHVKHHEIIISNCVKLLKPGGVIFITAIGKTFRSLITVKFILERFQRIIPLDSHQWRNFINCSTVEEILNENGCTVINRSGIECKKTRTQWSLCDNCDAIYILHATKNSN